MEKEKRKEIFESLSKAMHMTTEGDVGDVIVLMRHSRVSSAYTYDATGTNKASIHDEILALRKKAWG